jgi:sialate O-acetylesterase
MPSRRSVAPAQERASRGRVVKLLFLVALLVLLTALGSFTLLSTVHGSAASGAGSASGGELRLSNALGSNMVLQRGVAATLWGQSVGEDTVECTLLLLNGSIGEVATSQRSATGSWAVSLRPQPAGGPHQLLCTSSLLPGATVTLTQVYFGDVFLCAGQSNMVFTVNKSFTAAEEVQDAATVPRPGLRLFAAAPDKSLTAEPVPHAHGFRVVAQPWSEGTPAVVSGFSAVCWTAGRTIYDALGGDVPIGLIATAAGGSCIEKWMPDISLRACGQPVGQGSLYSAMVVPLVPYTRLAGVLWYQGESNVGPAASGTCGVQGLYYENALSQLLAAWRLAFDQPDLPWAHVQLSPYTPLVVQGSDPDGTSLALVRHAQLAATQRAVATPTVLVTAIDQGDADSPYGDIHPRGKAEVGKRLAGAMLHLLYGNTTAVRPPWRSPVCVSAQRLDTGPGAPMTLRVAFQIEAEEGLVQRPPTGCHPDSGVPGGDTRLRCSGWELHSGADGRWHSAQGVIIENGTAVVMGAPPGLQVVVGVRYAWSAWPALSLFSTSGLPALPCALDVMTDGVGPAGGDPSSVPPGLA